MNLDAKISQIDELIRTGNRDQAILLIKDIKINTIPRHHVNALANLARRTGQLHLAWKIISPIIRPKVPLDKPATDVEKATYAIILLGLGALPEAFELLESADNQCPDVNLALAFAHINSWDYASAATKLKAYLRAPDVAPYQRMIAKVNLAASFVATGNGEEASPLLNEILDETQKNGWHLLFRNSLEIRAQLAVQQGQWEQAQTYLQQAVHDGQTRFYLDSFLVKKWQAIMALIKEGPTDSTLENLAAVRTQAEANKHWETIRDCDYYKAVVTKDQELALRLYFGTPFATYRKRLMERGKGWLTIPKDYHWNVSGEKSNRVFRLNTGEEVGGVAKLKPGTAIYKTFVALTSDFYRPFSIGNLHSLVFPKEYFNPDSSPRRVAFLIQRLRNWLKESEIPLQVKSENDGFKLQSLSPYTILLEKSQPLKQLDSDEPMQYLALLKKIKEEKKNQILKASDISEITGMSIRSVRYFLKWAVDNKKVQKLGSGRETRYKIK